MTREDEERERYKTNRIFLYLVLALIAVVTAVFLMTNRAEAFNINCGIQPILPIGATGAFCVCDKYGQNCQWVFVYG